MANPQENNQSPQDNLNKRRIRRQMRSRAVYVYVGMNRLDDLLKDEEFQRRKCLCELEKMKEDLEKLQVEINRQIQQLQFQQQEQKQESGDNGGGAAPATGGVGGAK